MIVGFDEVRDKRGFTAVELLIVIATIAVLAAILLPKITTLIAERKAMRDLVMVNRIVNGLGKFYEDCGSYPTEIKGLIQVDGTNTLNGSDMTNCWHGPYIQYPLIPGSSTAIQGAFGTANQISINISANPQDVNGDGLPDYYVELKAVPEEMAKYLERKIDDDDPNQTNASSGKWVYTCNGGTCDCKFVFREL